jgi:hypothetical protein
VVVGTIWLPLIWLVIGVPYGSRTRVAAVKAKRITVIQRNFAAWIALYRTSRTHGNSYWTLMDARLLFGRTAKFRYPDHGF